MAFFVEEGLPSRALSCAANIRAGRGRPEGQFMRPAKALPAGRENRGLPPPARETRNPRVGEIRLGDKTVSPKLARQRG